MKPFKNIWKILAINVGIISKFLFLDKKTSKSVKILQIKNNSQNENA